MNKTSQEKVAHLVQELKKEAKKGISWKKALLLAAGASGLTLAGQAGEETYSKKQWDKGYAAAKRQAPASSYVEK